MTHANGSLVLQRCKEMQQGFLRDSDVALIAADDRTRLHLLLIRCGGGRFMAPAQDVAHFVEIIERDGRDYVRDVSIPTNTREA